jgi:hypothetical protein
MRSWAFENENPTSTAGIKSQVSLMKVPRGC